MKKVFSGIQSSGKPSLGNYLGAFKNHVAMQDTHNSTYCVVDLHSITARQDPAELRENSYSVAAWYLACGLDPQKATLFIQSHVSAHAELGWALSTFTQMGELERMTQYKDKSSRSNNINAGLFGYPVLMAADILLHQTEEVPVGHDQIQHVELTRDIATRFNNIYGDIFTIPEVVIPKIAARVKDLQEPTRKMSKSLPGAGCVLLEDEMKVIEKKVKRAVTDNLARVNYDEQEQAGVSNLLGIYAACNDISIDEAVKNFDGAQYGQLKGDVASAIINALEPIQKRYLELMNDKAELDKILAIGAEKAAANAKSTLANVYDAIGFIKANR